MKKLALALIAALAFGASASAQVITATQQIPIVGTVAASTRIVTGVAGKQIIVTSVMQIPVATAVVTYTTGTGTNCGTGTVSLTGALTFSAGQILTMGDGASPVLIVPTGSDLCITIATAAAPGSLSYTLVP
jgi:hypothetical protein